MIPGTLGRVKTILLTVEAEPLMLKPILPDWDANEAPVTSSPGGGVQLTVGKGEFMQYSKASEPILLVVGGASMKSWAAVTDAL